MSKAILKLSLYHRHRKMKPVYLSFLHINVDVSKIPFIIKILEKKVKNGITKKQELNIPEFVK